MKSWSNRFLLLVIVLDVVFVAMVVTNSFSVPTYAQESPEVAGDDLASALETEPESAPVESGATSVSEGPNNKWTATALSRLGSQLELRNRELEQRELELEEMMHADWVRRTMDIAPDNLFPADTSEGTAAGNPARANPAAATSDAPANAQPSPEQLAAASATAERSEMARAAFEKLQKAYANMEPTTAAEALSALAKKDQGAVVQMLLGWQPRVSGAILDAITQVDPALAADLSYEIWRMGGEK